MRLLAQLSRSEVIHGGNAEGVRDAVEKCEHGDDVDGLGDLLVGPAKAAKLLRVRGSRGLRTARDEPCVVKQRTLSAGKLCARQLPFRQRLYCFLPGSLQLQEECVGVDSIDAVVQRGDVGGNHLLHAPRQMSFAEMDSV